MRVFCAGFDRGWEASLAQESLQKLGKRLSELLDEDQWKECEALLLAAGVTPNVQIEGLADTGLETGEKA